ncbi:acyltransferase family protein [Microbacterium amylolyticum]|uniref:Membrane protein YcfT n=1 Tax=Microbacterium amylolyticum TaxID=936337 RepID=A0ABS4ZKS6_9MICO|nr:acyltransferase family protein [Microbacterium amylolyticum]MBP2437041.1 putative membrane protein YcfT [Microbacterium amylolyticum]
MHPASRIAWIDAARAICVLGVVLMHTVLSIQAFSLDIPTWRIAVDEFGPFRMSALSLLSGLLLSRRIRTGWHDSSVRSSIAHSLWLYAVWLLLFTIFAITVGSFFWTGPIGMGTTKQAWQAFASQLILPRTVLWYVLALAVWSALLTTVRRADPGLVLVLLGTVSVLSSWMPLLEGSDQYRNICRYAVFFAIGVYGARLLRRWMSDEPARVLGWSALAFVAFRGLEWFVDTEHIGDFVALPRDIAGALALLAAIVFVCRLRPASTALAWIGRRTLPIYVMHGLLLELLILFPGWWVRPLQSSEALLQLSPILITLGCAAAAIAVYELAMRTPARVVFVLPTPVAKAVRA